MINLNNKGQSLVMFVLVIPILLLVFILVIDIGNAFLQKQELDNINYLTIEYGLDNISDNNIETKLINMINKNKELNEINVLVDNNKIIITTKKNITGIFAKNFKLLEIKSSYSGYIENNKKIIERVWCYG